MGFAQTLLAPVAALGRAIVTRPLRRGELGVTLLLLALAGTAYCTIYCRVAFYRMHEGAMPLWLSAWWATTALLPWFLAFEAVKRLMPRLADRRALILACIGIAGATAAATILAQRIANIDIMGLSASRWPSLVANQLQPTVVFALLIGLWASGRSRHSAAAADAGSQSASLPALTNIEWIRAAGNYIELKCGDRLLIRRMTMRSAEAATRAADFVRIHRSIIVRRRLIRGFAGSDRSQVLLTTGETMPIGDSYRLAVERIVTSSHDLALHPIAL